MKVRWTSNSVRFRITPSELAALERGESIEETLQLPGGAALWRAVIAPAATTQIDFQSGALVLQLSLLDRCALAAPDREGVYFTRDVFRYFIEKDFPCAHPRAADALETPTETFSPSPDFEERKNA